MPNIPPQIYFYHVAKDDTIIDAQSWTTFRKGLQFAHYNPEAVKLVAWCPVRRIDIMTWEKRNKRMARLSQPKTE